MKDRRHSGGLPTLSQIWTGAWLALLAFFVVLWVTDALAQYQGYSGRSEPPRGWYSEVLEEQRRQTELMEEQQQREFYRELRESRERQEERVRRTYDYLW